MDVYVSVCVCEGKEITHIDNMEWNGMNKGLEKEDKMTLVFSY